MSCPVRNEPFPEDSRSMQEWEASFGMKMLCQSREPSFVTLPPGWLPSLEVGIIRSLVLSVPVA